MNSDLPAAFDLRVIVVSRADLDDAVLWPRVARSATGQVRDECRACVRKHFIWVLFAIVTDPFGQH